MPLLRGPTAPPAIRRVPASSGFRARHQCFRDLPAPRHLRPLCPSSPPAPRHFPPSPISLFHPFRPLTRRPPRLPFARRRLRPPTVRRSPDPPLPHRRPIHPLTPRPHPHPFAHRVTPRPNRSGSGRGLAELQPGLLPAGGRRLYGNF